MKTSNTPYLLAEIILGIVVLLGILLLLTNDVRLFISLLYSPYSFLVLVVMLLEYIFLKSMDRSRIYKLEIDRLEKMRLKERAFRQRLEKEIDEILELLDEPSAKKPDPSVVATLAESANLQDRLRNLLRD